MEVILHVPNPEYASQLLTEQIFYNVRNKIDEYAQKNNLSNNHKRIIYEQLIEELDKIRD